jgi:hypothetical protein
MSTPTKRYAPITELHPDRIDGLREVRAYIDALDLDPIKERLTLPLADGGRDWSSQQADYYEPIYRTWLYLRRKHENELMPPHIEMDELWHGHILDTYRYTEDCHRIFGYYFHHYPYFGVRSEADAEDLGNAWENTQRRYYEETGSYIYDFEA